MATTLLQSRDIPTKKHHPLVSAHTYLTLRAPVLCSSRNQCSCMWQLSHIRNFALEPLCALSYISITTENLSVLHNSHFGMCYPIVNPKSKHLISKSLQIGRCIQKLDGRTADRFCLNNSLINYVHSFGYEILPL